MAKSIPLALDERVIDKFRARVSGKIEPDDVLDGLHHAMLSARSTAEQIAATVAALGDDATRTPSAAAVQVRQTALKLGERAAKALDAASARIADEIARIVAETAAPPPPADAFDLQIEFETRRALARMSEDGRNKALADAIARGNDGDQRLIGAFLRGPAILTGSTESEREMRRHAWRSKKFPREVDRVARLKKAGDAAARAGKSLVEFVRDLAESPSAILAEAGAKRAADAVAAAAAE